MLLTFDIHMQTYFLVPINWSQVSLMFYDFIFWPKKIYSADIFRGRNREILSASSAFDEGLSKLHGDFATQANTAAVCAFLTIWAKSLKDFFFYLRAQAQTMQDHVLAAIICNGLCWRILY